MSQHVFISLLNPLLSLVLAAAFFVLWMFRPGNRYVARLVVCYLAVVAGFSLQSFDFGLGYEAARFLSNLLFFVALSLLASAVLTRQGLPVPVMPLAACVGISMAVMAWFLWVEPDFVARVFAVNYGLGAICVVIVLSLRRALRQTLIDRLVMVVTGVRAIDFFVRPLLVAMFDTAAAQPANITSPYWLATSLATIVFSLLIALTLLTAVALDTIEELQAESQTDPLSKLLNRRGFEQRSAALIEDCAAAGVPVALVLADLDHFKTVNDNHGHAAGDAVIAAFAERLRRTMGPRAIAGRIGGEEFGVLLPLADLGAAKLFAEAVRTLHSSADVDGLPPQTRVTASFGATERAGGEGLEAMMRRADAALYRAKRAGRDCVRVAPTTEAQPPASGRRAV